MGDPKKLYADPKSWEEYEKDTQEDMTASSESATASGGGLFGGGGVPISNLFGPSSSSGLGAVSGALFAAAQNKAKPVESDSDDEKTSATKGGGEAADAPKPP